MADIGRWPLPLMAHVDSSASTKAAPALDALLRPELDRIRGLDLAGASVAVAVGSRGIANIVELVTSVCAALTEAGAAPFLVPAMGSHGGGTAAGQAEVLSDLGLDPARTGVDIRSSLETVLLGSTQEGIPVHLDARAMAADGIYVVGRVKPHTSFTGRLQSGLIKLLVVGAGKVDGARAFHRATLRVPHSDALEAMFRVVLRDAPLIGGLAIIEDARHRTAMLEHIPRERVLEREPELLSVATSLMPVLPVDDLDVLVIDEIGKNISGAGMDPNVTGRRFAVNARWQEPSPRVTRIVALDLTEQSHGNAAGIGLADFVGPRLVAAMDARPTYLNAITSLNTVHAHVPLHFPTDHETLYWAVRSVGLAEREFGEVRLLHIRSTLDLERFEVSEALLPEVARRRDLVVTGGLQPWRIDGRGGLGRVGDPPIT